MDNTIELRRQLRVARKNARVKLELQRGVTQGLRNQLHQTQVRLEASEQKHNRLRAGLSDIAAYAARMCPKINGLDVKIGGVALGCFFGALRDYSLEVRDGTQEPRTRTYGTDLVSAARRWGIDFTSRGPI